MLRVTGGYIRPKHDKICFLAGAEIIVEDNGPGFDPDVKGDSGITLKNIRQRLEMMCNGSLTITPGDNGGTVVTITIPDSAAQ